MNERKSLMSFFISSSKVEELKNVFILIPLNATVELLLPIVSQKIADYHLSSWKLINIEAFMDLKQHTPSENGRYGKFKLLRKASTTIFHGFCKYHDGELFKKIEQFDYVNEPEQNFLQARHRHHVNERNSPIRVPLPYPGKIPISMSNYK